MSENSNQASASPSRAPSLSRYLLIGAAVIALAAVGVKVMQSQGVSSPATSTGSGEAQPDVAIAITQLEKKLKENPNDAEGWRTLGWSLYGTGKYAEAAQAYRRATQLKPDSVENWSALGEVLVLSSNDRVTPDAAQAFAKALSIDPKDPRARYFSAMGKEQAGDGKGAVAGLLALLKDTPAGAPWEENVRALIGKIGQREGIKVDDQLAAIKPPPSNAGVGAQVATAAIPGPSTAQMREAAAMPKGQQDAMIQGMVDGLDAKLKANSKNLNGWIMLMRSRSQLGESVKAKQALTDARAAFAGDGASLAKLSEAAAALGI